MVSQLLEVEIENFRGFATNQILPLDANVIVVSGGNGTGKTSLADALTWAFTGELPGLAERLRGERKGEDFVLSAYGTGPARVRVRVQSSSGPWDVERRGNAAGSELQVTSVGEGSTASGDVGLHELFGFEGASAMATAFHAWGVLRQDAMRATLEQGSETLHRRLREILGLGALASFEAASKESAQAASHEASVARQDLDRTTQLVRELQSELQSASHREAQRDAVVQDAARKVSELRESPIAGIRFSLRETAGARDIAILGRQVRELSRVAIDLITQLAGFPPDEDAPTNEDLVRIREVASRMSERLRELEAQSDSQIRLAEAALQLLSDHCPVCAQSIEQERVRADLQERLSSQADLAALQVARREAEQALSRREQAEAAERRVAGTKELRNQAADRWQRALDEAALLDVPEHWLELTSLSEAQTGLQQAREALLSVHRAVSEAESDPAVARLAARISELSTTEADARDKAERAAQRAQLADSLRRAATASAVEITDERLHALEPAFAEVYDRLAPHPSFTHLRMFHEVYYGKGRSSPRIVDPVRGIEANPNLVCSEGQLNIVALSYFLALNLESEKGTLPFAILDDPLQAMDVINVLGFCDVARALRSRRQIVVTTHDRRFASLLERKLNPRAPNQRLLHLRFTAWDRSGPRVAVEAPPLEEIPQLLQVA